MYTLVIRKVDVNETKYYNYSGSLKELKDLLCVITPVDKAKNITELKDMVQDYLNSFYKGMKTAAYVHIYKG